MTAEPSPRPWRVMRYTAEDEPDRIIDANGDEVAIELLEADAALIVSAVNERDRLRAALDKMVSVFDHIANSAWFMDANFQDTVDTIGSLNDARAALGAGETPTGKGVGR